MKKINIFLAALLALIFTGCSDDDPGVMKGIYVAGSDANGMILIPQGESIKFEVTTHPSDAKIVKINTDFNYVFEITEDGYIQTYEEGKANLSIVAQSGKDIMTRNFVVVSLIELESIDLAANVPAVNIATAGADKLNVSSYFVGTPATASFPTRFEYLSSDETIATVDDRGNITPRKPGKVEIRAKAIDGTDIVSEPVVVYAGYESVPYSKEDWSAVASAQNSANQAGEKAIDGNISGSYYYWYAYRPTFPLSLLIDMKEVKTFDQVAVYTYSNYARKIEIWTTPTTTDGVGLDDTSSFTKLTEFNETTNTTAAHWEYCNIFPDTPASSRYVKIVVVSSWSTNYGGLTEVDICEVKPQDASAFE